MFTCSLSIIGLCYSYKLNIYGLSIGITLGYLIAIIIMIYMFYRENGGLFYTLIIDKQIVRKYLVPLMPLVISQSLLQLLVIIDDMMATYLLSGNLSVLFLYCEIE